MTLRSALAGAAILVLAGCASTTPAPVLERAPAAPPPVGAAVPTPPPAAAPAPASAAGAREFYTVKRGDTLYAIALEHGQDYKDIAAWNGLGDANVIRVGQVLRVAPPEGAPTVATARPVTGFGGVEVRPLGPAAANTETYKREPKGGKQPYSEQAWAQMQRPGEAQRRVAEGPPPVAVVKLEPKAEPKPELKLEAPAGAVASEDGVDWTWPAAGRVLAPFREPNGKGVDIAGKSGDPVSAAADGKVLYVGANIRGYGNLVVVKHNAQYLTAYAHNRKILVKENQTVSRGQKIAEMGDSDADQPKLHFEIRRQGKPVDPLKYLPAR